MKIVLCTQQYQPPLVGGVDVYTERLRQALVRQGQDVAVFAFDATSEEAGFNIVEDVYDSTPVWRIQYGNRPKETFDRVFDPELGDVTKQLLEAQQPDVMIVMNFYRITFSVVAAAKALGIVVGHVATDFLPVCRRATFIRWHGRSCEVGESVKNCAQCFVSNNPLGRVAASLLDAVPESKLKEWAEKQDSFSPINPLNAVKPYLRQIDTMAQRIDMLSEWRQKVDFVLPPTRYTKARFLENGYHDSQLYLAPFGVEADNDLAKMGKISAEQVRFLFVGRFQPYKGAHLLLEAFEKLSFPKGATLMVIGAVDNHYSRYYELLEKRMATIESVDFVGRVPPSELANAFANADVFILPSTWQENMPLILLDALQSKTAVIASDIGGVVDVVKDGQNGLLFPMGDADALSQAMQRLIDDRELLDRLQAGIDLPNIDDYAQKVIALSRQYLEAAK